MRGYGSFGQGMETLLGGDAQATPVFNVKTSTQPHATRFEADTTSMTDHLGDGLPQTYDYSDSRDAKYGMVLADPDARIALRMGDGYPLLISKGIGGDSATDGVVVLFAFCAYSLTDEDDRAYFDAALGNMLSMSAMWTTWDHPDVLLIEAGLTVNQKQAERFRPQEAALTGAGVTRFDVLNVVFKGGFAKTGDLSQYETVVAFIDTSELNGQDANTLGAYATGGGRLVLIGDSCQSSFAENLGGAGLVGADCMYSTQGSLTWSQWGDASNPLLDGLPTSVQFHSSGSSTPPEGQYCSRVYCPYAQVAARSGGGFPVLLSRAVGGSAGGVFVWYLMRWGNYEDDIAWGTTLLKNAVALTPAQCEWDAADVLVYEPMAWGYGKSPSQFAPVEAALTAAGVRYDVLPALDFSISRRPLSEYSAVVVAMNGGEITTVGPLADAVTAGTRVVSIGWSDYAKWKRSVCDMLLDCVDWLQYAEYGKSGNDWNTASGAGALVADLPASYNFKSLGSSGPSESKDSTASSYVIVPKKDAPGVTVGATNGYKDVAVYLQRGELVFISNPILSSVYPDGRQDFYNKLIRNALGTSGGSSGASSEAVRVRGVVRDAVSGEPLAGVRVTLTPYGGATLPDAVTDKDGRYDFGELQPGAYSVHVSDAAGKHFSAAQNIEVRAGAGGEQAAPIDVALSPNDLNADDLRFVLSWGAQPADLDAHLEFYENGDTSGEAACDVYYGNTACSASGGAYTATLDADARSGFGPETVTVRAQSGLTGTFQFFAYNYANDQPLYSSAARLDVYGSSGLLDSFEVPAAYASPPETCGPRTWKPVQAVFANGSLVRLEDRWRDFEANGGSSRRRLAAASRRALAQVGSEEDFDVGASCLLPFAMPNKGALSPPPPVGGGGGQTGGIVGGVISTLAGVGVMVGVVVHNVRRRRSAARSSDALWKADKTGAASSVRNPLGTAGGAL